MTILSTICRMLVKSSEAQFITPRAQYFSSHRNRRFCIQLMEVTEYLVLFIRVFYKISIYHESWLCLYGKTNKISVAPTAYKRLISELCARFFRSNSNETVRFSACYEV